MDYFKTRDLPTAALQLASDGIEFHGIEGSNPRNLYFLFTPRKKAEELALSFLAGKAKVNARLYADSFRRAKDIIFETERRQTTSTGLVSYANSSR